MDVSMQTTMIVEHQMSLGILVTHIGVKGMENICELG
jgi:hypothetical protein